MFCEISKPCFIYTFLLINLYLFIFLLIYLLIFFIYLLTKSNVSLIDLINLDFCCKYVRIFPTYKSIHNALCPNTRGFFFGGQLSVHGSCPLILGSLGKDPVSGLPVEAPALGLLTFYRPGFPLPLRGSQAEHDNCVYVLTENKLWCYFVHRCPFPIDRFGFFSWECL